MDEVNSRLPSLRRWVNEMSGPSQFIGFTVRDNKKYVPSFGLTRRGCIRRKAKRPTDESSGVEDMTTFVGHPVAVILVREDDLHSAPNRAFSIKCQKIRNRVV
jgi:hypothetical protein